MKPSRELPLVYSCSGASSAAQMANHIAVRMDRLQVAEMSCIAGVGGDVKPLVRTAKSGRPIIALDGCPLHCAAQILRRHGLTADKHYDLSESGVKKQMHKDFDPDEAARLLDQIVNDPKRPGRSKSFQPPAPQQPVRGRQAAPPDAPDTESPGPSSPVCYLDEFKDW